MGSETFIHVCITCQAQKMLPPFYTLDHVFNNTPSEEVIELLVTRTTCNKNGGYIMLYANEPSAPYSIADDYGLC